MYQAITLAVIIVLTIIDQLTKYAAVVTVKINGPEEFLFGLFQFRYAENTGAAFSSFSDNTTILSIFTVIVIAVGIVVVLSRKIKPIFLNACLVLILSGGIGNAVDRIRLGYVVDFIEPLFIDFAIFNFADCCITAGAFLMIGYEIYDLIKDYNLKKHKYK